MTYDRSNEETFRREIHTSNGSIRVVVYEGGYLSDEDHPHSVVEIGFRTTHCRDTFILSADPLVDLRSEMRTDLEDLDSLIEALEHARFRLREAAGENGVDLPDLNTPEVDHQPETSFHDAHVKDVYASVDGDHHVVVLGKHGDGELDLFETRLYTTYKGRLDKEPYKLVHRYTPQDEASE